MLLMMWSRVDQSVNAGVYAGVAVLAFAQTQIFEIYYFRWGEFQLC